MHWGEVWTPGANEATTLSVSRDVTLEGVSVPQGSYSVWLVVDRGPWELILDPGTMLFHTMRPNPREGQVRLPVRREKRAFTEALTWSFPDVRVDGVTLVMQWDTVAVPLRIDIEPSYTRTVIPEVAERIVGRYRIRWEPPPMPPADSTLDTSGEGFPSETMLAVGYEQDELRATMDPPMFTSEPGYAEWLLIPVREGYFNLARLQDGELVEIMDYALVQFDAGEGPAAGFEARAPNDALLARGTRVEGSR